MSRFPVVVPCFKEIDIVAELLERFLRQPPAGKVVLFEDGSYMASR
jgi:hypothetical protein